MQKEWLSFRLTLLLYSIVLIIPLTFYFVYTSFDGAEEDTKVIRQIGWVEGVSEFMAITPIHYYNPDMTVKVDNTLETISTWIRKNNNSEFYTGKQTLLKDFSNVTTCWNAHKQKLLKSKKPIMINIHKQRLVQDSSMSQRTKKCSDYVTDLTSSIENMVYLKENKLINMFYRNLAAAMFLSWLMIYMVRSYIHMQMKKHAIYDHDTKLFNKKYFLAELKTSCARAVRHKYPLSMLSISIEGFEKGSKKYDKKTEIHMLEMLGGLITFLTRTSDTACRYDENSFFILLPYTEDKNALILEKRVREAFEKNDFIEGFEIKFKFAITQFQNDETPEAFVGRTQKFLN